MGFGISCTCTKCNAKQEFFLGVGYLNFADPINPTEKVVYICPKCSDWKEETICQDDKKRRRNYSAPKIPGIMQDFQQRQVLQLQRRLLHVFLLSQYKNGF